MKIPVIVAARLLGISADFLRWSLRQDKTDLGWAIRREGSTRWDYYIDQQELAKMAMVTIKDIRKAVELYRTGGVVNAETQN
jgi:hypothetical protein